MFDTLWKNLTVATMRDGYDIIDNAAIGIREGKIEWIGQEDRLPGAADDLADYVVDGEGRLATPGLVDCHTHLVYAGDRAAEFEKRLQGVSYEEISKAGGGIAFTTKMTREATEDELVDLAAKRLRALFSGGVSTIEIKSGYGLSVEGERKILRAATKLRDETGLRVQRTFLGAHAIPAEFKGRADDYISLVCNEMLPAFANEGLIDAVDAYCEKIGFTV
jgi:imidazolonepropionase